MGIKKKKGKIIWFQITFPKLIDYLRKWICICRHQDRQTDMVLYFEDAELQTFPYVRRFLFSHDILSITFAELISEDIAPPSNRTFPLSGSFFELFVLL